MTYAAELDDRRQEVRRGNASAVLHFWPKVLGTGNVAADPSPAPSYSIVSPTGTALASGTGTITAVDGVSRIGCVVDASLLPLGENYSCLLTWTTGGVSYLSTIRFDVVLEPWDGADCGLNDLTDEVADIGELLDAQAQAQGTVGRTREQQAALLAAKATSDVKGWLRQQLAARGRIYPRLVVQREELRRVVAAQALARAFRAQGGGADSASRALAKEWEEEARNRLLGLGELDYDEDEDQTADSTISVSRVVTVRRSW